MIDASSLGKRVRMRRDTIVQARQLWEGEWQDVADLVAPRKADITHKEETPDTDRFTRLWDTTACRASLIHAAGEMSLMTPIDEEWFALEPPPAIAEDGPARDWFEKSTESLALALAKSNFYSEIHECFLDRAVFGTAALHATAEGPVWAPFTFRALPVGAYGIATDHRDIVDTVSFDFELTAVAALGKYGEDALPEEVVAAAKDPSRQYQKFTFFQLIYPRPIDEYPDEGAKVPEGQKMPIASVTIFERNDRPVEVTGFHEMPTLVSRYLKYSKGDWGVSPGMMVLGDVRSANTMAKDLVMAGEVAVYPRILASPDLEGNIDVGPHGVTWVPDGKQDPRTWMEASRLDVARLREDLVDRRTAIEEAFHVPVFQMFAQLDKQMTATEVLERRAEKLNAFTPAFHRITAELLTPLLRRCFAIAVRQSILAWNSGADGLLPQPPESVAAIIRDLGAIPSPEVSYLGAIAMAQRERQIMSLVRVAEVLAPYFELAPEMIDNIDVDKMTRRALDKLGVDPDLKRRVSDVMQLRTARAEAALEADAAAQQSAA